MANFAGRIDSAHERVNWVAQLADHVLRFQFLHLLERKDAVRIALCIFSSIAEMPNVQFVARGCFGNSSIGRILAMESRLVPPQNSARTNKSNLRLSNRFTQR